MRLSLFLAATSLALAIATPASTWRHAATGDSDVDFERDIRPILEANCAGCHGSDKQKSGLRLDARDSALAGGYSGDPAVVPFDASASELVRRIRSTDKEERMPPGAHPLGAGEIDLLTRWIEEGAPWGAEGGTSTAASANAAALDHWAYVAPVRPPVPDAASPAAREGNVVDRFIARRLAREGFVLAPQADPVTLLRRLSLDLIGLPPTPEETDAFLANLAAGSPDSPDSPDSNRGADAYEREVDRLLASPHFGERWGRHWLDLAHYSDSNGGGADSERSIWPYRDWVIDAFNDDVPFDRFTIEQFAGDLLPEPSRDQLIATGFHRNTMIQEEGGADPEEYRVEAVKNRVETTGIVWMGSTLICAQCHDHKYDPFTMRDYYGLYAYFNQTQDGGRTTEPKLEVPSPEQELETTRIDAAVAELERRVTVVTPELAVERAAWEKNYLEEQASWKVLEPLEAVAAGGADLTIDGDHSVVATGKRPDIDSYTVVVRTKLRGITAIRLEVMKDERVENNGPGRGHRGNFVLSEFRLSADGQPVVIADVVADYSSGPWPVAGALDGDDLTGWGIHGRAGKDHEALFRLAEPLGSRSATGDAGDEIELTFELDQGLGLYLTIGRFRLAATTAATVPAVTPFLFDLEAIVRKDEALRTEEEQRLLDEHFLSIAPSLQPLRDERERLLAQRPQPPTTLVMRAVDTPRASHIQLRGNFLDLGERVQPEPPGFLFDLKSASPADTSPEDRSKDRLELARWLVDRRNPLTARVVVNRYWQKLFGTGLVATENDFGTRGDMPSHPELLDWLAVEFMERGWRRKAMLRLLVTSRTYRQSSEARPELDEIPGSDRWYARQARPRLEAEAIRDSALLASGLLERRIGGPSVYPPLPEFVSVRAFEKEWPESDASDRFRRTLYTWHWRTSPYPFLTTFDAPDATVACTRRSTANNALQALVMANDPMIFEIARGLAARVLTEGGATDDERIARAVRWCLGRAPTASESETLREFLATQRASFASSPEDAAAAAPESLPGGIDVAEGAAWTALARVLFNLDEFVTRA